MKYLTKIGLCALVGVFFFQLQFSMLGYINYLCSKCHQSKIQAWQLFWAAGLEVLAALMGQWEQSLLWQESDETLGESVYFSSSKKCLLFEQPSGNMILQGVSPIYCPHLHKTEIFKCTVFVRYIFCRRCYSAAAGRLLWLSLFLNTGRAQGWDGPAGLPEYNAVIPTTDFTGILRKKFLSVKTIKSTHQMKGLKLLISFILSMFEVVILQQ